MKDLKDKSDVHSLAFRLRPHLLQLFASIFNRHIEKMPYGIVALVDQVSYCLCGASLYHADQLHLAEFAALDAEVVNRNIDMDILVRKNNSVTKNREAS